MNPVRKKLRTPGSGADRLLVAIGLSMLVAGCGGSGTDPAPGVPALVLGDRVAETWTRTVRPGQNDWSWGDGVMMFGLTRIAAVRLYRPAARRG
jgi:hypothetical protein